VGREARIENPRSLAEVEVISDRFKRCQSADPSAAYAKRKQNKGTQAACGCSKRRKYPAFFPVARRSEFSYN
jgi:hypothetical protein